jgi:translation initiation factor eIF-2B subunit beta
MFDHVPASLVNLFISNEGSHPPSYIYRMLSDYYHSDDIE